VVATDRIERVPVTVGIRGSRNVEIVGDVSRGMAVLSPARVDLADGTKVRIDSNKVKQAASGTSPDDAAPSQVSSQDTSAPAPSAPAPAAAAATDPDNAVISAAISAHIDSVVNDARRNVARYSANP
jgi:hypothetical protein